MAEKSGNKWLIGCGIGCGVLVLLVLVVIGVGYFFVRNTVTGFQGVETSAEQLEETYGKVGDYTPDPGGRIASGRIMAFISVRDSSAWHRQDLENSISTITGQIDELDRGERSFWDVIGVVKKGFRFIPQIAEYYRVRNEALLNAGMGLGEYYHIYTLAYYSWLGKRPEDGPEFQLVGEESGRRYSWSRDDDEKERHAEDVIDRRRYRVLKAVHRFMVPMMERQLDSVGDYDAFWKRELKKEISAMEDDRDRIPWEDGLPGRISGSLEPYRSRLESSYSRILNALELQMMDH